MAVSMRFWGHVTLNGVPASNGTVSVKTTSQTVASSGPLAAGHFSVNANVSSGDTVTLTVDYGEKFTTTTVLTAAVAGDSVDLSTDIGSGAPTATAIQVQTQGSSVVNVPAPTGVAATDQANIAAAIAALPSTGGTVQLQSGGYVVTSSVRVDTVSNSGPSTTWTDTSIVAGDVGSYVIGPYIVGSGGTGGRAPKITAVTPGVGFTTDIAPVGTITSQSLWITNPGVLLPEGVKIRGVGGIIGRGTGNYFSGTSSTYGTGIIDTAGTGVTVLDRGSNSYGARYGLYDLVIWGGAGAWGGSGYTGNCRVGVFISNNSWWFEMDNVDISYYSTAGIALDGNMNAQDFRNVSIQHIGTIGATTPTGGILCYFFSGKVTSAGINCYNCSIDNIYGSGIAGGPGGGPGGGSGLAAGVNFYGGQLWNCNATSWATYSGFGMVCEADFSSGKCVLNGSWLGTNGTGDLWLNGGSMECVNTTFTSSVASTITTYGNLGLTGCDIYATSANAIVNNGSVTWNGVTLQGSATKLYSGGPTAAACLGIGSSANSNFSGTTGIGNGASTNLTALAKSTGTGPASDVVNAWLPVTINGTAGWIPFFV